MAFELGPDGKPVEVATSFNDKTKPPAGAPQANKEGGTAPPGGWQGNPQPQAEPPTQPGGGGGQDMFAHVNQQQDMRPKSMNATAEPPTKPKASSSAEPAVEKPKNVPPAEPKTQLFQAGMNSTASASAAPAAASTEMVCGWLVIVDGPGRGSSVVVGPGQSFVSRSTSERICLNFGDETITSGQQFRIIYDDEEHEFVVGPGDGANPTRLNGKILASSMPLVTGDVLKAGKTSMRFVAFCGEDFNWN